jgi:hypothetical protein
MTWSDQQEGTQCSATNGDRITLLGPGTRVVLDLPPDLTIIQSNDEVASRLATHIAHDGGDIRELWGRRRIPECSLALGGCLSEGRGLIFLVHPGRRGLVMRRNYGGCARGGWRVDSEGPVVASQALHIVFNCPAGFGLLASVSCRGTVGPRSEKACSDQSDPEFEHS